MALATGYWGTLKARVREGPQEAKSDSKVTRVYVVWALSDEQFTTEVQFWRVWSSKRIALEMCGCEPAFATEAQP